MRRAFAASLVPALLFLAAGATAAWAQSPSGVIQGRVVNGTSGADPIVATEVILLGFKGSDPLPTQRVQTGPDGTFRIEGLETGSDYSYFLYTEYQNVQYGSDLLAFAEDETELNTMLEVFETTTSDEAISLYRVHYVINFVEGNLEVTEVQVFSNSGDRTYIGEEVDPSQPRPTVRFVVPEEATDLRFQETASPERFLVGEDEFADTAPVIPGLGTLQVSFSYLLPYDGSTKELSGALLYPATAVNVFVFDAGVEVSSEQLASMGTMGAGEQSYLAYVGQGLGKGDTFSLQLSGEPETVSTVYPEETGGGLSTGTILIIGGMVVLLLALAVGYPMLRRKPIEAVPVRDVSNEDEREELLMAIVDLDEAYEAGELSEEVYQSRRRSLKDRLKEL